MKVYERQEFAGGMGGSHYRVRVVELNSAPKDEPGVSRYRAASDTPFFDWTLEADAPKVAPFSEKDADKVPETPEPAPSLPQPPNNTPT